MTTKHPVLPFHIPGVRNSLLLWVARLDNGAELKVTDPKEQQGDVEEEKTEGEERWDGVDCSNQRRVERCAAMRERE